jgi:transmembrane sensor
MKQEPMDRDDSRVQQALDRLTADAVPAVDVEAALRRVHRRMNEPDVLSLTDRRERRPAAWRSIPVRIAAALALAVGAGALYYALGEGGREPLAALTHETGTGQVSTVTLVDGSTVVLGPASRLVVLAGYGAAHRQLELAGIAAFDVAPDDAGEFVVRAGRAVITDLGTAFAVRSDPGSDVVVMVTSGSVRLDAGDATGSGVVLRQGDRGTLAAAGAPTAERAVDPAADVAWTRGALTFDDARFDRVAADVRRWYGIELVAGDSIVAERHLTATFEGDSMDDVITVISLAWGARAERRGGTVILRIDRP